MVKGSKLTSMRMTSTCLCHVVINNCSSIYCSFLLCIYEFHFFFFRKSLQTLASTIVIRQKDLESCKRDIKQHSSNIRDFEMQHNIPHNMYIQNEQLVQGSEMHMNIIRTPVGQHPAQISTSVTQDGLRPPPPYASVPPANGGYLVRPPFPHYQNVNVTMQQPQYMNVKMENGQQLTSPSQFYSDMVNLNLYRKICNFLERSRILNPPVIVI